MMDLRTLLKSLAAGVGATLWSARRSDAALPKARITRVKCWAHPSMNRSFNQSALLVTVETDLGITGIGEGGSPDLIRDLAGSVIGQNPFEIERLWQHMYMDTFYPPGREKIHGQGAIDLALWDIKGKALQLPVSDLLHGASRNYVECYATTFRPPSGPDSAAGAAPPAVAGTALRERARAAMEAGYRVFRVDASIGGPIVGNVFSTLPLLVAILVIFAIMLTDFFDTMGTVTGVAAEAGLTREDGSVPGVGRVLLVDSIAAFVGGAAGVSSNTTYIESAAGVAEGGKTGFTSVVTGVLFLLAIFLAPLAGIIPSQATAPALVLAWLILGEKFAPLQLAGFCLLLSGIYLASRGEGGAKS